MMTVTRAILLSLGLFILVPQGTWAQARQQRLTEPDASFPEAFGLVGGVRELPDGRVLVADPLGQALVALNLDASLADTLGRVGQGPQEYRQPDGLFPLPGDSTLLVDLGNGRLTVLGPDGSFGATAPIASGRPGPGEMMMIRLPQAVDGEGRVYFRSLGGLGQRGQLPTHAPVLRWDRTTGAVDTVGIVKLQDMTRSTSGGMGDQRVSIQQVPFSPSDGWAVSADGRVVFVRADSYRLEWVSSGGTVRQGPAVSYDPVSIGRAEKEEWFERSRQRGGGIAVGVTVENGVMSTSFRRGGASDEPDLDAYEWPGFKPPFEPSSVRATPEGEVWVQRETRAGEAPLFDIFSSNGQLTAQVTAPPGRRLVGFGKGVVYLVRTDEFDLQYLERYRRS